MFLQFHSGSIRFFSGFVIRILAVSCLAYGAAGGSAASGAGPSDTLQSETTFFDVPDYRSENNVLSPTPADSDLHLLDFRPSLQNPLVPIPKAELVFQTDYRAIEDFFPHSPKLETGLWQKIKTDHQIFYGSSNLRIMLIGLAIGGTLANTNIDTRFHRWQHGDSPVLTSQNQLAVIAKACGEGGYVFPAFAGCYVVGELSRQEILPFQTGPIGQWGQQGVRSVIVGLPVLAVGQLLTGASRPEELRGSTWRPFQDDNGISGHAFVGALPFLTAANMTDNFWAKSTLVFCSTFPAWSRLHDDAHYLSQTVMGWGLAYFVCQSIHQTEDPSMKRNWDLRPLQLDHGLGDQRSASWGLSLGFDY